MHQLERTHRGDPRIAVKMAIVIETKSLKQLRDKRREPAYVRAREASSKSPSLLTPPARRGNRLPPVMNLTPDGEGRRRRGQGAGPKPLNSEKTLPVEINTSVVVSPYPIPGIGRDVASGSPSWAERISDETKTGRGASIEPSSDEEPERNQGALSPREPGVVLERCDHLLRPKEHEIHSTHDSDSGRFLE
jgi:hypothetical protein